MNDSLSFHSPRYSLLSLLQPPFHDLIFMCHARRQHEDETFSFHEVEKEKGSSRFWTPFARILGVCVFVFVWVWVTERQALLQPTSFGDSARESNFFAHSRGSESTWIGNIKWQEGRGVRIYCCLCMLCLESLRLNVEWPVIPSHTKSHMKSCMWYNKSFPSSSISEHTERRRMHTRFTNTWSPTVILSFRSYQR